MEIKAEQLASQLKNKGLLPIYFISGDEPLQMMEAADTLRHFARQQGFEERVVLNVDRQFDWTELYHEAESMSLFASRKIIECRMNSPKPGREGAKALVEYAETASPDNVLLITSNKLEKETAISKWYKTLDKRGGMIRIWPIEAGRLPDWILSRASQRKLKLSDDAAALIANRVEGNMLAASQEIELLALLNDKPMLEAEDVLAAVSDSARFDPYELTDSLLAGDVDRGMRILNGLRDEGSPVVFLIWVLLRDIRMLCSAAVRIAQGQQADRVLSDMRVFYKRKALVSKYLRSARIPQLHQLLLSAGQIERMTKGAAYGDYWQALSRLCLELANKPSRRRAA